MRDKIFKRSGIKDLISRKRRIEKMKLWKDNRIEGEWELEDQQVIDRFITSRWNTPEFLGYYCLDRAFRFFLTGKELEGGLQSVFDQMEFEIIFKQLKKDKRIKW